jgi:signal transduction histidine kinase
MAGRLAWGLSGSVVLLVAATLVVAFALTRPPVVSVADAAWLVALGSYAIAGAFIASRHLRNGVGWLLISVGVLVGIAGLADAYAGYAVASGAAGGTLARWLQSLLWDPAFSLLLVGLPLLFPAGRLPSGRWRAVAAVAALATLTLMVVSAIEPGPIGTDLPIQNPFGWEAAAGVLELIGGIAEGTLMVAALLAVTVPVWRYRGGTPQERQQLVWFAYAIGLLVALLVVSATIDSLPVGDSVGVLLEIAAIASVPVAIAVAILRHGLYDLRVVVSRTVTYGILSVAILLLYTGVIASAGVAAGSPETGALPVLVVIVVAVAFHPARVRLQQFVERRLFGLGRDPYAALQQLGHHLAAVDDRQVALRSIVATVREVLRLPYAAIEPLDGELVADGRPAAECVRIPMRHAGKAVGDLVVSPPRNHRVLSGSEQRLLEDLARVTAVAIHATQLTDQLFRSRQALVDAREDERRRLRRDLHDGLGPELAGLALHLEAAAASMDAHPAEARKGVTATARQLRETVDEVRRIVYDLRPPALDDLGLLEALCQRASQFHHGDPDRGRPPLAVAFEVEGDLGSLPAAVEVAAYRIITEAMVNAWRHSGARRCTVGLRMCGELSIDVTDDGSGIAATAQAGVGMTSMVERASELGGGCWIGEAATGGTMVRARIPVMVP